MAILVIFFYRIQISTISVTLKPLWSTIDKLENYFHSRVIDIVFIKAYINPFNSVGLLYLTEF